MIPKIIHYCWFGRNPKPQLAHKCISSWKQHCPDYTIIEWNEDNYDLSAAPLYVRQAYAAKKWAFVTDFIRLQVVYDHGGIYMDTDVELRKSIDGLLNHHAYFGFENEKNINTGLGFGAEKGAPILGDMMKDYMDIPFLREDGTLDLLPCPLRNTEVLLKYGLVQNNRKQILQKDILILPTVYLCPYNYVLNVMRPSFKTISIHWFDASWQTEEQRIQTQMDRKKEWINILKTMRYTVITKLMGEERYHNLKNKVKGIGKNGEN